MWFWEIICFTDRRDRREHNGQICVFLFFSILENLEVYILNFNIYNICTQENYRLQFYSYHCVCGVAGMWGKKEQKKETNGRGFIINYFSLQEFTTKLHIGPIFTNILPIKSFFFQPFGQNFQVLSTQQSHDTLNNQF